MNPNLIFFFGGGGAGGAGAGGARVSDLFSQRIQILKKKNTGVGGGVGGAGRGRWMDRRTGLNQFAPSTSTCINVQVMSLTSSVYDHFII